MLTERTFRTDGGTDTDTANGFLSTLQVTGLICDVKKIAISNEGKLSVALEAAANDTEALERVQNLISIQQGEIMASFEGVAADSMQLQ